MGAETPDSAVYLERLSLIHVEIHRQEKQHVVIVAVIRDARYLDRKRKAIGASIRSLFVFEEKPMALDHDLAWTSLSRLGEENVRNDVEKLSLSSDEHPRPVINPAAPTDSRWM